MDLKSIKGAILIEVLISMALSFFITACLLSAFSGLLGSFSRTRAKSEVLTTAQAVYHYFLNTIGQAGLPGCAGLEDISHTILKKIASGFEFEGSIGKPKSLVSVLSDRSKAIIETTDILKPGDNIVISDCIVTEKIKIKKVEILNKPYQQLIIFEHPVKHRFAQFSEVFRFINRKIYLAKSTLYEKQDNKPSVALFEGVKSVELVRGKGVRILLESLDKAFHKNLFMSIFSMGFYAK